VEILQLGMGWFPEQAGGLNRFYYDLTNQLYSDGVGIHGLVAGTDSVRQNSQGLVSAFSDRNASLVKRWWAARKSTTSILDENHIDVAASHFALYTFPVLDKLNDIPLVVHFQGPWAEEGAVEGGGHYATVLKKFIEKSVYNRASRYIVLSSAFGEILARCYGVDEGLIHVIPGGVNSARFAVDKSVSEVRDELGWSLDRPIVLVVRRLARRMGLENLLDAVEKVRRDIPDILVLIAGKGPLHEELEAVIAKRNIGNNVRLLGFVPDEKLPLAYRAANLTIVPTVSLEGFGLITLESMAAGTPVLVTPVGGLPETVSGLSEQLILPGYDSKDLAWGMRSALEGSLRLPSEKDCIKHVQDNFDWSLIGKRVLNVYSEALS